MGEACCGCLLGVPHRYAYPPLFHISLSYVHSSKNLIFFVSDSNIQYYVFDDRDGPLIILKCDAFDGPFSQVSTKFMTKVLIFFVAVYIHRPTGHWDENIKYLIA
jgi:hypothetical protein